MIGADSRKDQKVAYFENSFRKFGGDAGPEDAGGGFDSRNGS